MERVLYTVGHSNHPLARFLELLAAHRIAAVGDVRSTPYSRRHPHFDRERLREELHRRGIAYLFLGAELGARPSDPGCYVEGKVSYARLAATHAFRAGLARVEEATREGRLALLCAERDPLGCHRAILVCRHLRRPDLSIRHILADGTLEAHAETERRLLALVGLEEVDLFEDEGRRLERAYEIQAERLAWARTDRG
jgi:uncharacterized protein (DUF488 family)